jgi:hypothetical protein
MDITTLAALLSAETINLKENREVVTGYCGDFLSFVIGKAPEDGAWFTVMSNANVAAVALLADVAVIVLCESIKPDESLSARCKTEGLNILSTGLTAYEAAVALSVGIAAERRGI